MNNSANDTRARLIRVAGALARVQSAIEDLRIASQDLSLDHTIGDLKATQVTWDTYTAALRAGKLLEEMLKRVP